MRSKVWRICLLTILMGSTMAPQLWAQPNREFVDSFNRRFLTQRPKVGETLPDAEGYDSKGNKFSLKQTRGSFTVIVFGCLT